MWRAWDPFSTGSESLVITAGRILGCLRPQAFTLLSYTSYWATSRASVRATNRSLGDPPKSQPESLPSMDDGSPTAAQPNYHSPPKYDLMKWRQFDLECGPDYHPGMESCYIWLISGIIMFFFLLEHTSAYPSSLRLSNIPVRPFADLSIHW